MPLELITAPAEEPVTTAEVKSHLRLTTTADDTLIASLIPAARQMVEAELRRSLVTTAWRLHLPGFPASEILLPKPPTIAVSSITYLDVDGASQTWSADEYEAALKSRPARIRPRAGYAWPQTCDALEAVAVNFTAGYGAAEDVPQNLRTVVAMVAAHLYLHPAAQTTLKLEDNDIWARMLMPHRFRDFRDLEVS